ncbi:hypothetical protein [Burkholderia sp. GS2Y]|uniref:Uncharacterized protein n=1 Tax=Burkholderia theae TaxID=3143496 RepID=A0ABU9WGV2_9BURK
MLVSKRDSDNRTYGRRRLESSSRLTMHSRADLSAEKTIALKAFEMGLDDEFPIESGEHTFASRGWLTVVTSNRGTNGKVKVGRGKKPGKKTNLVGPTPE